MVTALRCGAAASLFFALAAAGCKPDLDQAVSIVSGPQILAVRSDPAEGAPKAQLAYTVLAVDRSGIVSVPVEWDFCEARKPLAELGPVSPQCLQASGDWFVPIGVGGQVTATMPDTACRQFGPDVPQPVGMEPPGRPVDPDQTGGYYQPVRVAVANGAAPAILGMGETRISCDIAGTPEQLVDFKAHYVPNANPAVDSLTTPSGALVPDDKGGPNALPAGQAVPLTAAWVACPQPTGACGDGYCDLGETAMACPQDCMTLKGCTGAESYVNLDLVSRNLVIQREGMEVAWFATAGSFDSDRTGTTPADLTPSTANVWHAPSTPGPVHMWVVLRDDRGGVGWSSYTLDVR